jgi:DNA polymerase-3 subunit gamma/tau
MAETGSGGNGYIVIARKWRPAAFDEVVGQEHVTRTLKNAITGSRVAHAYLFTGPRGVGKTTVARVLAKALNCADAPTVVPCGKCAACTEIAHGTSLDVIEIDGASNRGIDEIRNLRESVRYAPVGGKKKVYIIDEVHMLTQEAFNALLKTLEEPPPHVVFVFATTQPLKVPQTIVSRCQRFDFRRIATGDIVARLMEICKGEGYKCEEGALALVAQQAEGSMRDAQSMLEQVLAFGGGSVTEADMRPIMGLRGSEILSRITTAIVSGNEKGVMELLGDAFDSGVDPLDLASNLIERMRYLVVASIDPESRELGSLTAELRKQVAEEAAALTTEHLLCLLSMAAEAEDRIKHASHQRYMLESVILRMTKVKAVSKISDLVRMLGEVGGGGADQPAKRAGASEGTRAKPAEGKAAVAAPGTTAAPRSPATQERTFEGSAAAARGRSSGFGKPPEEAREHPQGSPSEIGSLWQEIIESFRETKASLASILDLCEPPAFAEGVLWLALPSTFHEGQVTRGDNLRILTQKITELTNTSVVLRTRIVNAKDQTTSHHETIADKHPIVRALIKNLGGKIVDVRPVKQHSPGSERTS